MKFSQAILFVHDAVRMQAFYEQLGLRVVEGSAADGFVQMADPAGGAVLALHYTKAIGPGGPARTETAQKLCFHADDVEVARGELVHLGVTMREIHRYEGIAFCDGVDPE